MENILIRGLTEEEKKKLERLNQEYYREEGLAKGMEEGLAKGMEEGLAKGRKATKLEDVDKLVASGVMDAAKACEILGVPYDEYENRGQK